ncbi:MAG: threonine/serine dehydratase [Alphaproteobacteria bacterium]|nr:threonine/serine dehydratase [Alphaproteobacteria bacterium]
MAGVAFETLRQAAEILRPVVVETPILESPVLNELCGARVLLKAESLQRTGSFKFRGAYYRIARLDAEERARGVVAFSSGNFAQGLAAAGALAGVKVTIVMPEDAPRAKMEATRRYGADVVLSRHGTRNREEAANELAAGLAQERGMTKLHPFDDPLIVAGQASVGLEFMRQAAQIGVAFDAVMSPVGGGGLVAGVALAVRQMSPKTRVYGVEPEGYDDMARSLATGARQRVEGQPRSVCDALQAAMPGVVTFDVAREFVSGGLSVSDDEVLVAMDRAFHHLKLVLEPSGAVALAAALAHKLAPAPATLGVILSGGNIAIEDFRRLTA